MPFSYLKIVVAGESIIKENKNKIQYWGTPPSGDRQLPPCPTYAHLIFSVIFDVDTFILYGCSLGGVSTFAVA